MCESKHHIKLIQQFKQQFCDSTQQPFTSLCQVCFGQCRWWWVVGAVLCGSEWFKSPSSPKTISTIFPPRFESAGLTLSASQMSEEECGPHQWRALSLHTLDTRSARLNTTQTLPHLLHFPQAEEVQEFNNKKTKKKEYFEAWINWSFWTGREKSINCSLYLHCFLFDPDSSCQDEYSVWTYGMLILFPQWRDLWWWEIPTFCVQLQFWKRRERKRWSLLLETDAFHQKILTKTFRQHHSFMIHSIALLMIMYSFTNARQMLCKILT